MKDISKLFTHKNFNKMRELVKEAIEENPTWVQVFNGETWYGLLPDGDGFTDVVVKIDKVDAKWRIIHSKLPALAAIVTVFLVGGFEEKSFAYNKVPDDFYETTDFEQHFGE